MRFDVFLIEYLFSFLKLLVDFECFLSNGAVLGEELIVGQNFVEFMLAE